MKPKKPQPRKPITIPKAAGPDPAAPTTSATTPTSSASPTSATSATSPASATSRATRTGKTTSRAGKEQLAIWMDANVLGRARTAWRTQTGDPAQPYQHFSQWIAALIETAVIDSEQRLNNGIPYLPTPKGQIGRSPHP